MFEFLKSKGYWGAVALVAVILGLFATVQFGIRNNITLHRVPVAIVNQDGGRTSQQLVNRMTQTSNRQIKWVAVKQSSDLASGYAHRRYYGALIIQPHFSRNLGTQQAYLQRAIGQKRLGKALPAADSVQTGAMTLQISQGANASLASVLTAALPKMTTKLNQQLSQATTKAATQAGLTLPQTVWQKLSQPITVRTQTKNTIPAKSLSGMLPFMLTVFCWLGSMILSLLLWRRYHQSATRGVKAVTNQLLGGLVGTGLLSGVLLVFTQSFNVTIPDNGQLFWLLWANMGVYYLLQTAIVDWFGMYGYPVIILMWLMAAGALGYAPQMLPVFAKTYIYSWVPMRFGLGTLTDALYFHGQTVASMNWTVMGWLGALALVIIYLVCLKARRHD